MGLSLLLQESIFIIKLLKSLEVFSALVIAKNSARCEVLLFLGSIKQVPKFLPADLYMEW